MDVSLSPATFSSSCWGSWGVSRLPGINYTTIPLFPPIVFCYMYSEYHLRNIDYEVSAQYFKKLHPYSISHNLHSVLIFSSRTVCCTQWGRHFFMTKHLFLGHVLYIFFSLLNMHLEPLLWSRVTLSFHQHVLLVINHYSMNLKNILESSDRLWHRSAFLQAEVESSQGFYQYEIMEHVKDGEITTNYRLFLFYLIFGRSKGRVTPERTRERESERERWGVWSNLLLTISLVRDVGGRGNYPNT